MLKVGCAGFLGLCLLAVGISALSNLGLPTRSEIADRLSGVEKARLSESQNLRRELGDSVWPGWGQVDISVIIMTLTLFS